MFSLSLPHILALCSVLSGLGNVVAVPAVPDVPRIISNISMFNHPGLNPDARSNVSNTIRPSLFNHSGLDNTAREILARATPAPPHFVIYGDLFVSGLTGPPDISAVQGFTVFNLAFLLRSGPFDKAAEWTQLSDEQRATVKAQYAAAGIKLLVSAFGATDKPASDGASPIDTANAMAAWVKQFNLDGIDVDFEDLDSINSGDGKGENWLISFTQQLRSQLPQDQYILTHAPLAPWFSPGRFGGNAYVRVNNEVGSLIDWYNVQFYNQGTDEYTTCDNLLSTSSSVWPQTAVFQMPANGIPLNKIVIGKPATDSDGTNGFMDPETLAGCVSDAKERGWSAGAMVWQYPHADTAWARTVRSATFPI